MARTTDPEKKLATLKERLEKAKAIKAKVEKEIANYNKEISAIETAKKLELATSILTNPETAKTLFELGAITEQQLDLLFPKNSQPTNTQNDNHTA